RGMHTFELAFDRYRAPASSLVGGDEWLDRGFYLQMEGFAVGRIQTAARAVGVMQAALEDALAYARERRVFGRAVADHQLPAATSAGSRGQRRAGPIDPLATNSYGRFATGPAPRRSLSTRASSSRVHRAACA